MTSAPPSTTTATSALSPPFPQVSVDFGQEGFAAPLWDDRAYGEPAFASTLEEIADTGAEWVTLVPTWYQTGPESSVVYAERPGRTVTDEALVAAITTARDLDLDVMLKPHVDVTDGGSRLRISPTDTEQWFASYEEVLLGYAGLAEAHGVSQFVVGTELAGTSDDAEHWRKLIAGVRSVFSGGLTYAANHDEYVEIEFWSALDFIGVDAYFPLAEKPTIDVEALSAAWEPIVSEMGEFATASDRSVVFTEIGYPSQEGAATAPFDPNLSDIVSEAEQEAALIAMLEALGDQPWFGGFHWWMWFGEGTDAELALGYTPEGKPAETVLRERWAEG